MRPEHKGSGGAKKIQTTTTTKQKPGHRAELGEAK